MESAVILKNANNLMWKPDSGTSGGGGVEGGIVLTATEFGLLDPLPVSAVRGRRLYGGLTWKRGPPVKRNWFICEAAIVVLEGCTLCA